MAHGVFSMTPSMRRLASVFLAALLTLLVAGPAFGYNEENVRHIRVSRLDAIQCGVPIRLVADLRDRRGAAVPGAVVDWTFQKSKPGDTLNPLTDSSDFEGRARTTLTLACEKGKRVVKATVRGDGSGKITINCSSRKKCTIGDDDDDDDVKRITLERLDPISCETTMRFRATVYNKAGNPIPNQTVKFDLDDKEDGDKLTPKSQKTDANGQAVTFLDMGCEDGTRKIEAEADKKETSVKFRCGWNDGCNKDEDGDGDDENDRDNDLIVAPFDRQGGNGSTSPWTMTGSTSIDTSPFGGSTSQYAAIMLTTLLAAAVAGRWSGRGRRFPLTGARSLAPA